MTTAPTVTTLPSPGTGRLFGTELLIELGDCDSRVINDPGEIARIVYLLVDTIGMEAYGNPFRIKRHFGKGDLAGWTIFQLITTSNITVHANDEDLSAFVNVFSCAPFDPAAAAAFLADAFGAGVYTVTVIERRVPRKAT